MACGYASKAPDSGTAPLKIVVANSRDVPGAEIEQRNVRRFLQTVPL